MEIKKKLGLKKIVLELKVSLSELRTLDKSNESGRAPHIQKMGWTHIAQILPITRSLAILSGQVNILISRIPTKQSSFGSRLAEQEDS